jgi:hypothetical protein
MNKSRFFVGLLLVAILVMFAPASHAQVTNCQSSGSGVNCNVQAVGSSAIFPSAAIAAVTGDPQIGLSPICSSGGAAHFWSGKTGVAGIDPRATLTTPNIPSEGGTVWIAWDNDTAPTIICSYLSVDSIVGQRLFYSQGTGASGPNNNGTLSLNPSVCSAPGANLVSFVFDTATTGLPLAVYNELEGNIGSSSCTTGAHPVHFTTASTDVNPTDAKFVGNDRVLAPDTAATPDASTDSKASLGYGGNPQNCFVPGTAILGSYATGKSAQSICYTYVAGASDPISGTAIPSSTVVSEGALSIIPIINITDNGTGTGGFGDLYFNHGFSDVLGSNVAAGYAKSIGGTATLTRDLFTEGTNAFAPSAIPVKVVHYLTREPQSGTYTTWEWQAIRNKETSQGGGTLSQETNINGKSQAGYTACGPSGSDSVFPAAANCDNAMSWGANGFNALKTRVIGTGEMVSVANSGCYTVTGTCNVQDTFGYAFWSLGTFGGKSNIRYLQYDTNDGLYHGWSSTDGGNNGVFPIVPLAQGVSGITGAAPAGGCSGYFNGDGGVTVTTFSCNSWPYPTFEQVRNGNYRVWNINRVEWFGSLPSGTAIGNPSWGNNPATGLNPPAFWLSAADQTAPVLGPAPLHGEIPDFLPFGYCANAAACPNGGVPVLTFPLEAFRAHYTVPGWGIGGSANGIGCGGFGGVENGGDVAGAIIGEEAESDTTCFFGGSTFISWIQ